MTAGPTGQPLLPPLNDDFELKLYPSAILQAQKVVDGSTEVLVQRQDLPSFESTWKPFETIRHHFPDFNLEDKVKPLGKGNDGHPPITEVYTRTGRKGIGDMTEVKPEITHLGMNCTCN